MFYNYPPGESNVFGGAFLDTFASAAELLKGLKEAGYDTEECSGEELQELFVISGRHHSFRNPRDVGISSWKGEWHDRRLLAGPAGRYGASFLLLLYCKSFGGHDCQTPFPGNPDQLPGAGTEKE